MSTDCQCRHCSSNYEPGGVAKVLGFLAFLGYLGYLAGHTIVDGVRRWVR